MRRPIEEYSDEELLRDITTPQDAISPKTSLSSWSDEELLNSIPSEYLQQHGTPKGISEEESYLSRFGRGAARLAKDIPIGALATADFIATPVRAGMNAISGALGGNSEMFKPVSEQLNRYVDETTGGYTEPKNLTERITSGVTQGIAGMSPARSIGSAALKAAPSLSPKLSKFFQGTGELLRAGTEPTLTNLGATGAGITAREKVLEEDPNNLGNALGAEILANLGTRGLSHVATPGNVARSIGKKLKFSVPNYETMQQAKMPSTLGDVSDSKTVKAYENILRKTPFAGSIIDDVKEAQKIRAKKIFHQDKNPMELTEGHGGKLAGEAAQKSKEVYDRKADYLWKKVEKGIEKADKTLKTPNTNSFLSEEEKKLSSQGAEEVYDKSALGKLSKVFEKYHYTKSGDPKNLTISELRKFRDTVRDEISTFGLHGDVSQGELKHLEGKIQQDLNEYFDKIGPGAKKAWKNFNKFTSNYIQHYKEPFNDIRKKINARKEVKAFNISKPKSDDVKSAVHVMENLGNKKEDYLATVLNSWGDVKGNFEPLKAGSTFLKMDKSLQDKLLKGVGYSDSQKNMFKKNIESLEHVRSALNETNTSGTSYFENYRKTAARWGAAAAALVGKTVDPSLTLAPIAYTVGSRLAAKAYVAPKVQAWIHKGMTAKTDKMIPKWLEYGSRLPGIPKDVREGFKSLYMEALEADRKNKLGAFRKALPSIIESTMTRGKKENTDGDYRNIKMPTMHSHEYYIQKSKES